MIPVKVEHVHCVQCGTEITIRQYGGELFEGAWYSDHRCPLFLRSEVSKTMKPTTVETFPLTAGDLQLPLEQIHTIYLGRSDKCYCGCAGTYVYPSTSSHLDWQGKTNDAAVLRRQIRMASLINSGKAKEAYIFRGIRQWLMTVEFGENRALTLYTADETTKEEWARLEAGKTTPIQANEVKTPIAD